MASVYVSEFISTTRSSFMGSSQPASARNKKIRRMVGYDTCRIGIATITSFDKFNMCKYIQEEDARICYIYAQ